MLRSARYEKRKFRGLYIYCKTIMNREPLKLKESNTTMFICTYDIPDSSALRKYIGYFIRCVDNTRDMTLSSYKNLPIKEPSVPGNANTSNQIINDSNNTSSEEKHQKV